MIEQRRVIFTLKCDSCSKKVNITFPRYDDALSYARLNGWRLLWGQGNWKNICPECQEVEEK